ncbi:peptidoglycan DD-metalloendopeptidase family protein [Patescibacteria group bacterium]|nr:peptidoglycan DD-metalloendopeptidase family protein [Patescibacteria group bacterium]
MVKALLIILLSSFFTKHIAFAQIWERTTLESDAIECVEHSPWGVLAGELNSSLWINPENAVFISKDLGNTWETLGLSNHGIRDLKYYNGNIYAATYYFQNGLRGLYVSNDQGKNWTHLGISYAPVKIDRDEGTIYYGSQHYGLWVSFDEGKTWDQKLGNGGDGTTVKTLSSSENLALVSSTIGVYRSVNRGKTWEEISFLNNKGILYFYIEENFVLAASYYDQGLFRSNDYGENWEKIENFGNYPIGDITKFENNYFIGRQTPDYHFSVYKTSDFLNWENTGLDIGQLNKVTDLTWVFSEPGYLFAATINKGLYRYQIPEESILDPFLEIPWKYTNNNELVDKITAYFDHSYPLLGYSHYSEPTEDNKTTLNFLGKKDSEPNIYYSSHSGTDFGLSYGTEIVAPASGSATYFTCNGCGHSIRIDHMNGYKTTYMHLQERDIITRGGPVWVNEGDKIGYVGMTGKTTGPHLHFEVSRGLFPDGRTDPYGWIPNNDADPWPILTWNDSLGNHQGSKSNFLWKQEIPKVSKFIESEVTSSLNNISVSLTSPSTVLSIRKSSTPLLHLQSNLKYLEGTSFIIELFNQLGEKIENLNNDIKFVIDYSQSNLSNIILNTLKLYFWNSYSKLWEPLPSFLDLESKKLTAYSSHLSEFAILGEKEQKELPETQILVSGSQNNGWFYEFPLISFSFSGDQNNNIDTTFYSISENDTWEPYTQPVFISKNGFVNLKFRSLDTFGNLEDTNKILLKINTANKFIDQLNVTESFFEVNFEN